MPLDPAAFGELMRVIRGEARPIAAGAREAELPAGLFPAAGAAASGAALPADLFPALASELRGEVRTQNNQDLARRLRERMPQGGESKVRAAPIPETAAPGVTPTPVTAAPRVDIAGLLPAPQVPASVTATPSRMTARDVFNRALRAGEVPGSPQAAARVTTRERGTIPGKRASPETGAQRFLRDHLGYVPAGDPVVWARTYGLASPETYRAGTAQRHPTLYRSPEDLAMRGMPALSATGRELRPATGQIQLTRAQQDIVRTWASHGVKREKIVAAMQREITGAPVAEIRRAVDQVLTERRSLTPSQAAAPQSRRIAPPSQRLGFHAPNVAEWLQRRAPGIPTDEFVQRYFAGYVQNPSVNAFEDTLGVSGTMRIPTERRVRGRDGVERTIPAGTYVGSITRTIYRDHAYNNYFAIEPQYQGLGIAREILRHQVDLYRRMGSINWVAVSAGLDGGGHTWARFGFVPSADGWVGLRQTLRSRLNNIPNLDPAQQRVARALISSDNPVAIRALAALPMQPGGTTSDLGRRLLAGTFWRGTLDLRDPETMRHFDAYTAPRTQ